MRSIKNNVFIARRERGLKQIDVAEVLLINKQTYHLKETGKSEFTILEGTRLARFYNCTLNDLFEDDDYLKYEPVKKSSDSFEEISKHLEEVAKILKQQK